MHESADAFANSAAPGLYDAGDQEAINQQKREAGSRDREDDETIRVWMNHPKGRDLLYRIVYEVCGFGVARTFSDTLGRTDTHAMYLHIGGQNIGAWFEERLRRHPALYTEMLTEQEIARASRDAQLKKQNERQERENG